jgi:glycosyltransferase involved in cell wall biosynthesis
MKPLVSVIIPIYNRIELAIRSIQSALNQTYERIEVIVIDDGSTDDIRAITTATLEEPRLRYIRQHNRGAGAARNIGIAESTGEYIAFLDSDDYFLSNKLEIQLKAMTETKLEFSHTSYVKYWEPDGSMTVIDSGTFAGKVYPAILSACPIACPTVVITREMLGRARFPENLHPGEDVLLWVEVAAKGPVLGIRKPLTVVSANPTSNAYNPVNEVIGLLNIATSIFKDPNHRKNYAEIQHLLKESYLKIGNLSQTNNL